MTDTTGRENKEFTVDLAKQTDAPRSLVELRAKIERDGCGQFGPSTVDIDEAFALYDAKIAALEREVAELRAQLPDEMQDCTILFKECEKGHGRLTATNWIDHGCPWCQLTLARAQVREQAAKVAWNIAVMRQQDAEHWAKDNQELPLPLIVQVMNAEAKMARDLADAIRAMPLEP